MTTHTFDVGEPTTGLWCGRCALPSLVEFPLYCTTAEGVTYIGPVRVCTEEWSD